MPVVLVVLILSIVVALTTSILTRPIRKLTVMADRIASGDEEAEIGVKGSDEVGVLSRSLKVMLDHLKSSRSELKELAQSLEEAVEKRTYDLGSRVKELNGLYGATRFMAESGKSVGETLMSIVNLLPQSCQYPEVACARITVEGLSYSTPNYRETE